MKFCRALSLFLSATLICLLIAPSAAAMEPFEVTALSALLIDVDDESILYSKNETRKMYPASITKIMTVLLVLEAVERGELSMDQVVTASKSAFVGLDPTGSTANIKPGEQMSVKDLLYCTMLVSANEACNILAEATSGNIRTFVANMNDRAQEIGCLNTHFSNAHGLHDPDHYSTAWDLYLLTREVMKNEVFMTICGTASYDVPATNLSDPRKLASTNALLSDQDTTIFLYEGVEGIKTGTTEEAGFCLVSSVSRNGRHLVCIVLNCDSAQYSCSFSDSVDLYDYALGIRSFKKTTTSTLTPTCINALAATLVDVESGAVLYGKHETKKMFPAGITKVMTILLVLEAIERGELSLEQTVTVSRSALAGLPPDSSMDKIKIGEQIAVNDLLHCAILRSSNEACNVLAEAVAGDVDSFVARMNTRAQELGCKTTHFSNTHGLHAPDHYTTAWSICLIAREALKHESFVTLCETQTYIIPATNMSASRKLQASEHIAGTGCQYENVNHIQSGITEEAGYCLLSSANYGGRQLVCVVLKCEPSESSRLCHADSAVLYEHGFNDFVAKAILSRNEIVGMAPVNLSKQASSVAVHSASDISSLLPLDVEPSSVERIVTFPPTIALAPVAKGDIMGELTLTLDGHVLAVVPLLAHEDIAPSVFLTLKYRVACFILRFIEKITLLGIDISMFLVICCVLALTVSILLLKVFRNHCHKRNSHLK